MYSRIEKSILMEIMPESVKLFKNIIKIYILLSTSVWGSLPYILLSVSWACGLFDYTDLLQKQ
ncbi:MAG: hypothetical protein XD91_0772 [Clostridiales bacterium 38_11]|nr:MAG: hypothetical protein XD91_0772 [Clostridiales bacterium 38_11]HBH12110.1 hypothetical protein [Clostridiales bacterium]